MPNVVDTIIRNAHRPPGRAQNKRLVTVREYAQYYGVAESTVRGWIHRGHVKPIHTPGGGVRLEPPEDKT